MRKLLLFLVLFMSVQGLTQPGDSMKKNRGEDKLISDDSIFVKLEKFKDSVLNTIHASDSFTINENINRNVTGIMELQKKQRVKEKRGAMIRIGIGIAFLIILIIGLRRKTTKK